MGLFEKKDCTICGNKVNMLGIKLQDAAICSKCLNDYTMGFFIERDLNNDDGFKYKTLLFKDFKECCEHFGKENVKRKFSKELPTCLGNFAYDKENGIIEIKGMENVYCLEASWIDEIKFFCADIKNANKLGFNFIVSSSKPWLDGYLFSGWFKNDVFFKKGALKKAQEEILAMARDMDIKMVEVRK